MTTVTRVAATVMATKRAVVMATRVAGKDEGKGCKSNGNCNEEGNCK